MGSSGPPDKSLGSGISLPQWMRGKVDSRFDFDQSTFSPPSHDDSFFYIRYPSSSTSTRPVEREGFQPIETVLSDQKTNQFESSLTKSVAPETETQITKNTKNLDNIDFSKHPRPCQPFVPVVKDKVIIGSTSRNKSQGVDDGFHGIPALCGKSIVHVANRMMSSAQNKKMDGPSSDYQQMEKSESVKRGSRSLPVSPIASPMSTPDNSPKSRRRLLQPNRYFTGAFIPDRDKYPGRWILSSILSQSREVIGNKITEEDESVMQLPPAMPLNRKKSISSQNLTYINTEKVIQDAPPGSSQSFIIQAEPSELREMNFWSPTSM